MGYERLADEQKVRPEQRTRTARLFDCLLCRHSSGGMLLLLDAAYLTCSSWMFVDMTITFAKGGLLAAHWWLAALLFVPALMQLIFVLLRWRYVFATPETRSDVAWQLRHVSRPLTHSLIDTLPIKAYLLLAPLFGGLLLPANDVPVPIFERFVAAWRMAALRPSVMAVTSLFLMTSLANWRLSAKHRWTLRTLVTVLQARVKQATVNEGTIQPTLYNDEVAERTEYDNDHVHMLRVSRMNQLRPRRPAPSVLEMQPLPRNQSDGEYSPRSGRRKKSSGKKNGGKKSKKSRRKALQTEPAERTSIDVSVHSENEDQF